MAQNLFHWKDQNKLKMGIYFIQNSKLRYYWWVYFTESAEIMYDWLFNSLKRPK